MKVSAITCRLRRDEKWLVAYRAPNGSTLSAISDHQVKEGSDVIVRDGRVVG